MPRRSKGFTHGEASSTARYLIVQLKPGWRADIETNAFVSGRKRLRLNELLDEKISLQPHIHAVGFSAKSTRTPSAQELELARFVQVRVSSQPAANRLARQLEVLDGVERVMMPPEVSLPGWDT